MSPCPGILGRQIDTLTYKGVTWTYEYNADGLRTARTSATKDYFYVYNGTQLTQVTVVDKSGEEPQTSIVELSYDAAGQPLTMTLDGTTYFYLLNATGDILGLLDEEGNRVIRYACEGYGKSMYYNTGTTAYTLGKLDPLAYRGYVMDYGTGLYYLQSRSYNYTTGRFINADGLVSTGQGILSNNMFAYCGNNPVVRKDSQGNRYCAATTIAGEKPFEKAYASYWQTQVILERYNPTPIGRTQHGNVYLVTDIRDIKTKFPGDVIVIDYRGPNGANDVQIQYSYTIRDKELQRSILTILYNYECANPTGWNRTVDSMMIEWDIHNLGANIGNFFPVKTKLFSSSIHANFDNNSEGWSKCQHYIDGLKKILGLK